MTPKFFIGPMSKNVVDSVIDFSERTGTPIGLIPSRRQIDFSGGYVHTWTTAEFSRYVKSKTTNVLLVRDHSGPGQGTYDDDGYESLATDCQYLDVIHIDPWKRYKDYSSGLEHTIKMIMFCYSINKNILFEVGTEESIRKFEADELEQFVLALKDNLTPEVFKNIKYLVIQSGTSLKGITQTGKYSSARLATMINTLKKYGLHCKEHNGDYIKTDLIYEKFNVGLDCINIAPEFGLIETTTYLNAITEDSLFSTFYEICFNSNKWVKWVPSDFVPANNKKNLIQICGHYVLSTPEFLTQIKNKFPHIDTVIKKNIDTKLHELFVGSAS